MRLEDRRSIVGMDPLEPCRHWWDYEPNPAVILGFWAGLIVGLGIGGWFMRMILS